MRLVHCLVLSGFIILSACGGGSGGSGNTSASSGVNTPPPVSVPDPTPSTNTAIIEGDVDFQSNSSTRARLTPNGAVIQGVKDMSDVDAFVLTITERQTVRITITGGTLEFPAMQLLDDNENPIALSQATTFNDYQDLGSIASVTVLLEAGSYLIRLVEPLVFVDGILDFSAARPLSGTYEVSAQTVSLGGPDPDDLTVSGTISKGLLSNAPVSLYAVALGPTGNVITLGETTTDENGRYEVTISREAAGTSFYVASTLSGATTVCDAPKGCGTTNFGDQFTYADDGFIPVNNTSGGFISTVTNLDAFNTLRNGNVLFASVPTPTTAAEITKNVNFITTLMFTNIDIVQGGFASDFAVISVSQLQATSRISNLFGINGVEGFDIPFVDITEPVTSTDTDAIKAAMLAGGMQDVMSRGFPDIVYAAFIRDLLINDGEFLIRENEPNSETVSLEDIYLAALEIENVNTSTSDAYLAALKSLRDDLILIKAASADIRTIEGVIP